jgi:hypothetical protein
MIELKTFKFKNLKMKQSRQSKLSHKLFNNVFIIFYNHYLPKFSELKNQVPKLNFKI